MTLLVKNQDETIFKKGGIMLFILFSILILCSPGWAKEYFVSTGGKDTNLGTFSDPWRTLSHANNVLKAGDTVTIRGGHYSGQQIAPANSGSEDQRIIYRNYRDETVEITDTVDPIRIVNQSYITVRGFTISGTDSYLYMENANHNIIEQCVFHNPRRVNGWRGFWVAKNSSYNWIHHCDISEYGWQSDGEDYADMVFIGDNSEIGGTNYNLIEDNHIRYGGHNVLRVTDKYNVIRNNYLHNEEWYPESNSTYGNRIGEVSAGTTSSPGGGGWNLFEGNRFCFAGNPIDANYAPLIQLEAPDNIWRRNMFYQSIGPAIQINSLKTYPVGQADNNYFFHNVFYQLGIGQDGRNSSAITFCGWNGGIKGNIIKNNIFSQIKGTMAATTADASLKENSFVNNWSDDQGDPMFEDASVSLLSSSKPEYPNFIPQAQSPCVDAASFLTQTINSGTGTIIQVKDAHYFMDGWGMGKLGVHGDVIQLAGQSQTAQIIDVDYSKNVLTLDSPLTWSGNQGIALKYNGSAPDLGAIESGYNTIEQLKAPVNLRIIR